MRRLPVFLKVITLVGSEAKLDVSRWIKDSNLERACRRVPMEVVARLSVPGRQPVREILKSIFIGLLVCSWMGELNG